MASSAIPCYDARLAGIGHKSSFPPWPVAFAGIHTEHPQSTRRHSGSVIFSMGPRFHGDDVVWLRDQLSIPMQETFINIKSLDMDARGVGHLEN